MQSGIYKITNPKGKIYIGQSIDLNKREETYKKHFSSYKGQIKLYNSVQKYGWDNHIFEVIEYCNEDELLTREAYWKEKYDVLNIPSLCCKIEGENGRVGKLGKETINKIKEKLTGKKKPEGFGENLKNNKTRSNKISESLKGYKQSPEHIQKRIHDSLEKKGPKPKRVKQYTKENCLIKIWESVSQIKQELNINVYDALEKKNNTAGGFIWVWDK